ncbi:hypothetical protein [uncultured Cellulomonas sp.]|uniref:hypothetical protein n=1 Tax=uncultured Cellulomonas sp. TaxID=189682 RepID=UPI0026191677|nr:hypothetical protein [uncultured Cellulomonas sp.]
MRGSEIIELAADVLPRRVVRTVGSATLIVLVVTGTADDFARWFVLDRAAAVQEAVVTPMLERLMTASVPADTH